MIVLIAGLLIFFALHLLPCVPAWRDGLRERYGAGRYKTGFSLLSMLGFVLIITGMGRAPLTQLWEPPVWGKLATLLLMLPALYCLLASRMPSRLKRLTAHPMLWGMAFWAAAHLLSSGGLAAVALFASFAVYSLFDMASANARGARPVGGAVSMKQEARVLAATIVVYLALALLHPWIAGVPLSIR